MFIDLNSFPFNYSFVFGFQKTDDDLKLREASRKLQVQREKQKENARQKHAGDSRGYKPDRYLDISNYH